MITKKYALSTAMLLAIGLILAGCDGGSRSLDGGGDGSVNDGQDGSGGGDDGGASGDDGGTEDQCSVTLPPDVAVVGANVEQYWNADTAVWVCPSGHARPYGGYAKFFAEPEATVTFDTNSAGVWAKAGATIKVNGNAMTVWAEDPADVQNAPAGTVQPCQAVTFDTHLVEGLVCPGYPPGQGLCIDACAAGTAGQCDDCGADSTTCVCEYGQDCADCGTRYHP